MERRVHFSTVVALGYEQHIPVHPIIQHAHHNGEAHAVRKQGACPNEHDVAIFHHEIRPPCSRHGITLFIDVAVKRVPEHPSAIIASLNSAGKTGCGIGCVPFGGFLCAADKCQEQN